MIVFAVIPFHHVHSLITIFPCILQCGDEFLLLGQPAPATGYTQAVAQSSLVGWYGRIRELLESWGVWVEETLFSDTFGSRIKPFNLSDIPLFKGDFLYSESRSNCPQVNP